MTSGNGLVGMWDSRRGRASTENARDRGRERWREHNISGAAGRFLRGEMETTKLAHNGFVPVALAEDNYENWEACLKSYLLGEDLWDIVNGTEFEPNATQVELKTWKMKNAKALHAIQMSCGPQTLSHINKFDSAKDAWDHLASTHVPPSEEKSLMGQGLIYEEWVRIHGCGLAAKVYNRRSDGVADNDDADREHS
ncbi:hypothetical protein HHK36_030475 [Tetracentron sinense]|uniref:DUF4219 domain-containing protein n=1 Tax=Tetracentron sinense TaxID=13715 RepID=A0A834YBR9_TETSI|nr:hypothetical protein HHK36_030475 [Tetracentron sinense]